MACNQHETRARTVQWRTVTVLNSDVKVTHSVISGMYIHMLSRFLYLPPTLIQESKQSWD